ncbi:MAG: hypothetical protein V1872_14190 [bacterium]
MSKEVLVLEDNVLDNFEKLSQQHQEEVVDFIIYLKVREELESTKEIINDKELFNSIMKGEEEFRTDHFKRWSEVREDV